MALQPAAHAAAPAAATIPSFAPQVVVDNSIPCTSIAALASSQTLSAGLPSAYASHMQSFPMVRPALSVMIPTNTASQSYHNSPSAPQVCSIVARTNALGCMLTVSHQGCVCRWMCWRCVWHKTLLSSKRFSEAMYKLQLKLPSVCLG